MTLDLANINQTQRWFDNNAFYPMYEKLHALSLTHEYIYLAAPFVGLTDGVLNSAETAAALAETTLKGFTNLAGAPFFTDCNAYRGSLQLLFGIPAIALPAAPHILFRIVRISANFFSNPQDLAFQEKENYQQTTRMS
ncbi:MAG: hypothetical protein Tsb0015_11030 [Simkaniaceae bacterium]